MIYLDTHVVVWLYAGELHRFTKTGLKRMEQEDLTISPIVRLELCYLKEIGKITVEPERILDYLTLKIQLQYCTLPFMDVIAESMGLDWTRDPFDRIIAAQSIVGRADLMSKDRTLRKQLSSVFW